MNPNTAEHSTPTLELRWFQNGDKKTLQQKHEILRWGTVGDGLDGGETWADLVPSGRYKWVDVPTHVFKDF